MFECIPARLVLAITTFFGFISLYFMRFNFSVITVAMITPNQGKTFNESCDSTEECGEIFLDDSVLSAKNVTTLDWDERTRALVLGMFNYGYCLTQIVGGRLAELYGAKYIYGFSVTLPAILNFFIPMAAKQSYWGVIVIRFIQGVFQGAAFPCMQIVASQWYPLQERSRFMGIVCLAATFGLVFILPLSGLLCDVYSWEEAFYITGAFPLIWGVVWFSIIYSKPKDHPRISQREKDFIEKAIAGSGTSEHANRSIPWKSVFTSLPFLSVVVCDIGNSYSLTMFTSQMPNYMNSVFNYSVAKTGLLAGLPFFFRYSGSVVLSCLADYLISRKIITVATTRRVFSAIAMFGPAVMLATLSMFFLNNVSAFFPIICISMFLNGAISSSQLINITDIAPNFAGTLFGISNTFSSMSTFVFLLISGEILSAGQTVKQWSIVFWICVPVLILTEIFYLIFLSGTPQKWNFEKGEENHHEMKEKTKNEKV